MAEKEKGVVNTQTAPIVTLMCVKQMWIEMLVMQGQLAALLNEAKPERAKQIQAGTNKAREFAAEKVEEYFDNWHADLKRQFDQ